MQKYLLFYSRCTTFALSKGIMMGNNRKMKYFLTIVAWAILTAFGGSLTAQTLEQLARQNFLAGNYAEAKPQFKRCLKTAPRDGRINFWYGACCIETGEVEEALPYLEFAVSKKVQNAYRYLARYHYLKGNYADAADNLELFLNGATPGDSIYLQAQSFLQDIRSRQKFMRRVEKVAFIDSLVTRKASFLQAYHPGSEAGAIYTLEEYFGDAAGNTDGTIFLSELGNRRYYACQTDSGQTGLTTSYRMGDSWSPPQLVDGLADEGDNNYPFMLSDGTTFYYANNGPESMGGYDIFVTRYNSDTDRFLRSDNIGMPFNSPANDYMMVIDELNGLGWFATDRRQPEGWVCIYTFVWSEGKKEYYDAETDDPAVIRRAADIAAIAETQTDDETVRKAQMRLFKLMLGEQKVLTNGSDKSDKGDFTFVLDDMKDYHRLSDFHSLEARKLFETYLKKLEERNAISAKLDSKRNAYAEASARKRKDRAAELIILEADYDALEEEIHSLEKRVRNTEITFLSK